MFANQVAASAILVVTLHKHGAGGERAIDALVGAGLALARSASRAEEDSERVPPTPCDELSAVGAGIRELTTAA